MGTNQLRSCEFLDISDLLNQVENLTKNWNKVWFRGVNGNHPLVPMAYRENYFQNHARRLKIYIQKAKLHHPNLFNMQDADWFFIAQHNGIPTTLLDLTENIFVALFFSCDQKNKDGYPYIFVLNPDALNYVIKEIVGDPFVKIGKVNLIKQQHKSGVYLAQEKRISDKVAALLGDEENERATKFYNDECRLPTALYPDYLDQKMNIQDSCFTMHGSDNRSLEDIVLDLCDKFKINQENIFLKFRLKGQVGNRNKFIRQIKRFGPKKNSLFGDHQSLVDTLRNT